MIDPVTWLRAFQLVDSFFPSGLYTQSYGLEQWIATSTRGPAQLGPLLEHYLRDVVGPVDGVALRWTMRHYADLDVVGAIDQRLEATKLLSETRAGSRRSGRALLQTGGRAFGDAQVLRYGEQVKAGVQPGHHAVLLGLLMAGSGIAAELAVYAELHSFCTSWVGAAVRLQALDYIQAQELLHAAAPWITQAAQRGATLHWTEMGGWAPLVDIQQMQHAAAEGRLFAS